MKPGSWGRVVAEVPQPLGTPLLHQEQCSQRGCEPIWTRCSQPVPRAPGQPARGHRTGCTWPLCEGAAFCPARVYYPGTQLGRALPRAQASSTTTASPGLCQGGWILLSNECEAVWPLPASCPSISSLRPSSSSTPSEQGTPREHSHCIGAKSQLVFFFFFPRYSQAGFYLSTVCPQTYHFKWVRLLIDMNGAILDMKALLYLVSLVTAGASWSTDGVYLSCAKSVYWRNWEENCLQQAVTSWNCPRKNIMWLVSLTYKGGLFCAFFFSLVLFACIKPSLADSPPWDY